jgi:hypothetical protein
LNLLTQQQEPRPVVVVAVVVTHSHTAADTAGSRSSLA